MTHESLGDSLLKRLPDSSDAEQDKKTALAMRGPRKLLFPWCLAAILFGQLPNASACGIRSCLCHAVSRPWSLGAFWALLDCRRCSPRAGSCRYFAGNGAYLLGMIGYVILDVRNAYFGVSSFADDYWY